MLNFVDSILLNADYFILLLLRSGALVVSSPLFGRVGVPNYVKIMFTLGLTVMFFSGFPPVYDIAYTTLFGFALKVFFEIMIGITLAYITNLFFSLVAFTAGQLIDMQIGFGIVNVYDQQNNTQIPMVGNILNLMLLILFFSLDGHHRLFEILVLTFERIPVGNIAISPNLGLTVLEIFTRAFMLGVMVATPVIASGLIIEFCFGTLVRTVPQMNMFVVGIPIKILVGFLMLFITIPMFVNFSQMIFNEMFASIEKVFSMFLIGS